MTDDEWNNGTRPSDRRGTESPGPDGDMDPEAVDDEPWSDVPLADLADAVESGSEGGFGDVARDAFVRVDRDELDRDAIWAEIESSAEERFDPPDEPVERVVPKHAFCHRCRHFSAPPDVSCSHEGTEILELVDMDRFRIKNCPIAEEYERAGKSW